MEKILLKVVFKSAPTTERGCRYIVSTDDLISSKTTRREIEVDYDAADQLEDNIIKKLEAAGLKVVARNTRSRGGKDYIMCELDFYALAKFFKEWK